MKKRHRLQKKDFRQIICGDNGNGKSSLSLREGEDENPDSFIKNPEYAVNNQVHFFSKYWLNAASFLKFYDVNVYDEPVQSGGHHREFMSEGNIIITKTVATARFKRLNIPINIPFLDMLDKDLRKLCQVYIYCYDQGKAEVFKIINQKFGGDPWHEKIVDRLTWNMPRHRLWKLYEKKKFDSENEVYKKYEYKLGKKDKDERTDDEIIDLLNSKLDDIIDNKGKHNIASMMAIGDVGRDRANRLKRKMELNSQEKTNA